MSMEIMVLAPWKREKFSRVLCSHKHDKSWKENGNLPSHVIWFIKTKDKTIFGFRRSEKAWTIYESLS